MNCERGEIILVNLDPTVGSEIKKTRPSVVVSNDVANKYSSLITIVPLTSKKTEKIYPFEVLIKDVAGLSKESKAKVNQIRTIDKKRIVKKIGKISSLQEVEIDEALKIHLDILD
jgi:mRNA interferase MazF